MVQHDFEKKFMWSYQEFRGLQMAIKRKTLHQLKQLGIQPNKFVVIRFTFLQQLSITNFSSPSEGF